MKTRTIVIAAILGFASSAFGQFDLDIVEVYPFGTDAISDGDDLDDIEWMKIVNVGDAAWTTADGVLHYDDQAPNAGNADPISGITSIAAGESVLVLNLDGKFTVAEATPFFNGKWNTGGQQLGFYAGSGMSSSNDDGGSLFICAAECADADLVSELAYDAAPTDDGHPADSSYTAANGWGTPSIAVPEPGSAALGLMGLLSLLGVRRRR